MADSAFTIGSPTRISGRKSVKCVSRGQRLPAVEVDFTAAARAARLAIAERLADLNALRGAFDRARGSGPALYVLPTLYDPREPIPPYSERPEEIRLNFRQALEATTGLTGDAPIRWRSAPRSSGRCGR